MFDDELNLEKGGMSDSPPPSQNAPAGFSVARPEAAKAENRKTRCRDRAAAWSADMAKAASFFFERATTPEQRVEVDVAYQEALAAGPDFARIHRGSEFRDPPRVCTDRNHLARLMFQIDLIERKSWALRKKGAHGGCIGRAAITLFRTMLFVVNKADGCLFPSLETLARLSRMSKPTVIAAIKRLVLMGFLTVYRRCKRIRTAIGVRVVQDSNCYEFHPPTGLGALGWSIWQTKSAPGDCPEADLKACLPSLAQPSHAAPDLTASGPASPA
jgi:Helix-turn-helix domain